MSQKKLPSVDTYTVIYNKIKGLSVILYGEPGIGKSYFCAHLCRKAYELTQRRALYIALDENLKTDYGKQLRRIANAEWKEIEGYSDLWVYIATQLALDATEKSIVIIDSLTAVQEEVISKLTGPEDPRLTMIMSRFATLVSKTVARIAHKLNIPVIIITHPTTLFRQSPIWETNMKPAFMGRAMKNIDLVVEYFITQKGKRVLKVRLFRDVDKKPPFDYIYID